MKKCYKNWCLLLTGFFLFMSFAMVGQNLVMNGGFETGVVTPWFGDNGNTVSVSTDAAVGEYSAIGNVAQNINLQSGVDYEIHCKAKIISSNGERVWVGIRDTEGLVKNYELFSSDWEDVFFEFTADETSEHKIWIWGQGTSSYASDAWNLIVKGTTDVNDFDAKNKIKINNNTTGVSIDLVNIYNDAKVVVHDLNGRQLYNQTTSQKNIFIENNTFQAAGIYVVTVMTEKIHRVEKVMIVGN